MLHPKSNVEVVLWQLNVIQRHYPIYVRGNFNLKLYSILWLSFNKARKSSVGVTNSSVMENDVV
jgi:hypothetical protein